MASRTPDPRQPGAPGKQKLISASGLGGALLFCAAIALVRGGAKLVKHVLVPPGTSESTAPREAASGAPQRVVAAERIIQSLADSAIERQHRWQDIEAAQSRLGVSDEALEQLLREHWRTTHPEAKLEPWQVNIVDWRTTVDWDVPAVAELLAAQANNAQAIESTNARQAVR